MTKGNTVTVSIPEDIERYLDLGVLDLLLRDHSTDRNIIWATSAYEKLGEGYGQRNQITNVQITGEHAQLIKRRAQKAQEEKTALTRVHAEVFTPTWICKLMIDWADETWLADAGAKTPQDNWKKYVESKRLEITCGEAPYLVNRYDADDGNPVPVTERIGILDRKLQLITSSTKRRQDWMCWTRKALETTFGYEFQGDNLLIARINILKSVEDHLAQAKYRDLSKEELTDLAEIISWNLWQMDGLSGCVPFGKEKVEKQASLFPGLFEDEEPAEDDGRHEAFLKNWNTEETIEYLRVKRGDKKMKFDYIIGNPPYQEESKGANANDTPIYHYFYDGAFELSDHVELISPARFLFNAGGTPKNWNQRMLEDQHNTVLYYEPESGRIFPNTSISGGVAVVYHDANRKLGPISTFTPFPELNEIIRKVEKNSATYLSDIVTNRGVYKYSDTAYEECPKEMSLTADRRLAPSAFDRMPNLFTLEKPDDGKEYIRIYGVIDNKRSYRWFRRDYVSPVDNLDKWKVVVSKADGAAGQLGKPIPARICGKPTVLEPGVGFAETFIAVGAVETREEAEAICKYIKTRFARTMLGVLKVTQNNAKPTWQKIPMLDFSDESDIDWDLSIAEIDSQLYERFGLSQNEIDFIESHVKEMD